MKSLVVLLLCAVVAQTYAKGEYENGCPKNWTIRKLLPHRNCHLYYECVMGLRIVRTCPPFFRFSIQRSRCVWRTLVDCEHNSGSDEIPESEEDENHQTSEESGEYNPSHAPYVCAHSSSDGILIPHEKCNKFYICANGKPVALRCPANLLFNPKNDKCDWPNNVNCDDRVIPEPDDSDNGNQGPVGAGNSNPSEAPYICAAQNSTGVLIAHYDCNKYFICDHGKPVALRCPSNLYFNPRKDQCDWPRNVKCKRSI